MMRGSRPFRPKSNRSLRQPYCQVVSSSSSLVFCPKAGPWHPISPFCSVLRFPFHLYVGVLHHILQHTHSLSSSSSLALHASFDHFQQQPFAPQYMTNPVFLPF